MSKFSERFSFEREILVTHGTDTMAEGAFFLETTLQSDKSVAFVGSMRSGS